MGASDRASMTWEPAKSRWRKMYKGQVITVSCKELDVAPNKESSYRAANAWWVAKLRELEVTPPHPHANALAELKRRLDWASRHAPKEADDIREKIREVEIKDDREEIHIDDYPDVLQAMKRVGIDTSKAEPEAIRYLFGGGKKWVDRLRHDTGTPAPPDKTLGNHIDRKFKGLQARVHAGTLKAGTYQNTKDCLNHFRDWFGVDSDVSTITADTLENFHEFLLGKIKERKLDSKKGWSRDFTAKVWGHAKNLIVYIAGKGACQLPANITSRDFIFGTTAKKIVTMTPGEVKTLISKAEGQLRLHLLLMLNCGMTQIDIANLKTHEVDWVEGTITRKRSKTEDEENTPVVTYRLWRETFACLKRYAQPDHQSKGAVLVTKSGGLWVWRTLDDAGKLHRADNIATNYEKLQEETKINKSLKIFRKTSATKIESSPEFRHFRPLFLGHAPDGVGERSYADHSPTEFDRAVAWLGSEFGFA